MKKRKHSSKKKQLKESTVRRLKSKESLEDFKAEIRSFLVHVLLAKQLNMNTFEYERGTETVRFKLHKYAVVKWRLYNDFISAPRHRKKGTPQRVGSSGYASPFYWYTNCVCWYNNLIMVDGEIDPALLGFFETPIQMSTDQPL